MTLETTIKLLQTGVTGVTGVTPSNDAACSRYTKKNNGVTGVTEANDYATATEGKNAKEERNGGNVTPVTPDTRHGVTPNLLIDKAVTPVTPVTPKISKVESDTDLTPRRENANKSIQDLQRRASCFRFFRWTRT